jgi:hypothetical protein
MVKKLGAQGIPRPLTYPSRTLMRARIQKKQEQLIQKKHKNGKKLN